MKIKLLLQIITLLILPFAADCQQKSALGKPLRILTLGDSNGTFPYSWPKQIKQALPQSEVYNLSKSGRTIGFLNFGDTLLNSLLMIDQNIQKAVKFAKDEPFDFIVLELGTNDAKADFAQRQGEVAGNLEALILKIKNCGYPVLSQAKIIVISPPPYGHKAELVDKYKGGDARVKKMSKAFKKVARRNDCLFVNGYKTKGLNMDKMTKDGIHLDAEGSRLLVEPVLSIIKSSIHHEGPLTTN